MMSDRVTHSFLLALALLGVLLKADSSFAGYNVSAPVIGEIPLEDNQHAELGLPQSQSESEVLISRKQYVVSWSGEQRTPMWVAWLLNKRLLGDVPRSNTFRFDSTLQEHLTEQQYTAVEPDEYRGSCIDRGHQVASADRTATLADNQATFFMSNVAPQSAFLNRRVWLSFERFLRLLVLEQGKEVYIYSGSSGRSLGKIGSNNDINVRSSNFKIAVIKPAGSKWDTSEFQVLAVNFSNVTSAGTNPVLDRKTACQDSENTARLSDTNRQPYWKRFVTDIQTIESLSDLDFSFLNELNAISNDELDALIEEQLARYQFRSFPEMVMDRLTSFVVEIGD